MIQVQTKVYKTTWKKHEKMMNYIKIGWITNIKPKRVVAVEALSFTLTHLLSLMFFTTNYKGLTIYFYSVPHL